jgi:hypothetical protein
MMAASFNSFSFIFPLSLILSWINILQTTFPFYLLFSFSVFVEKITWKCFPVVTLSSPVVKIWAENKLSHEFISFKFQEIEIHRFGVCEICVCTQKQRLSMASNSTRIAFTLERTCSLGSRYIGDHSSWYLIDWQIDRITHRWALRERTANIYSAVKLQTPTSGGMEVTFSTGDTNDSYVVKLPSARKYTHTNVLVAQKQKETIFRNNSME